MPIITPDRHSTTAPLFTLSESFMTTGEVSVKAVV